MHIELKNAGKRYNFEWIFRKLDHTLKTDEPVVILGSNGSGKSTLLQILTGRSLLSEGSVAWFDGSKNPIPAEDIFRSVSLAAPYQELIEEFTLAESLSFHFSLKKPLSNFSQEQIIDILQLGKARRKAIRYFSSGMKQRLKLGLAILSDTQLLLLDEPCSNLDHAGMEWYRTMIEQYGKGRLLAVASNNQPAEFDFCTHSINILDYKSF
jgi:ABC-type multidrug transport system ATPase subunit